jgi:hypothetical protein
LKHIIHIWNTLRKERRKVSEPEKRRGNLYEMGIETLLCFFVGFGFWKR